MKDFKERWEITKNWQFIHPFLGILATILSGYLIARAISRAAIGASHEYYYHVLGFLTVIAAICIVKISLWCFKKLENRWKVTYRWEFIAIFLCFAATGSTAGQLSVPLMELIGLAKETTTGWLYWPVRILLIFPIYQVILVIFGWIFGQYSFFKDFAIKMVSRMGLGFLLKN